MSRKKNWEARPSRRGGLSRTLLGPGPYVSVYCSGDAMSPHQKYRICSFVMGDQPGSSTWVESTSGYAAHGAERYFRTMPRITQWLVGDSWLALDERRRHLDDAEFRMRWVLRCPHCSSLSRAIARPATLATAISALAQLQDDDGIFEVSLRAFLDHVSRWSDTP